jgi:hypothetical protein
MKKWMWGLLYLLSILLGNAFVIWFGIVTVAGLSFPAGSSGSDLPFHFETLSNATGETGQLGLDDRGLAVHPAFQSRDRTCLDGRLFRCPKVSIGSSSVY